jgi:hypothetical protein
MVINMQCKFVMKITDIIEETNKSTKLLSQDHRTEILLQYRVMECLW